MAKKPNVDNLANLQNETSAVQTINQNFQELKESFGDLLSSSDTSENTMNVALDMNGQRIINLPNPVNDTDPVRLADIKFNLALVGPAGPIGPGGPAGVPGANGAPGPQGAIGPAGPQGAAGAPGAKGDQGTGVTILGSVSSPSALPPSGAAGNTYISTGTGTGYIPGDGFVWVGGGTGTIGPSNNYINVGQIRGPAGTAGTPGTPGSAGPQGPAGPTTVSGLTDATTDFKALNTTKAGQIAALGAVSSTVANNFTEQQSFGKSITARDNCANFFSRGFGYQYDATTVSIIQGYGPQINGLTHVATWGGIENDPPLPAIGASTTTQFLAQYGGSETCALYTAGYAPPTVASNAADFTATTGVSRTTLTATQIAALRKNMVVKTSDGYTSRLLNPSCPDGKTLTVDTGWYLANGTSGTPANGSTMHVNAITAVFTKNTVCTIDNNSYGKTGITDEIDLFNQQGDFSITGGGPSCNGIHVVSVGNYHNGFAFLSSSQGSSRSRITRAFQADEPLFSGFEVTGTNGRGAQYGFLYNCGAINDVNGSSSVAYSVGNGTGGDVRWQVAGATGNMSIGAGSLPSTATRMNVRSDTSDGSTSFIDGVNSGGSVTFQVKSNGQGFFSGGAGFGGGTADGQNRLVVRGASTDANTTTFAGQNSVGTVTCQIRSNGAIYSTSTSISSISDARLKSNVEDMDSQSDLLRKVKWHKYIKDGETEYGVIAQELREVFPEIVKEGDFPEPGYLTVGYQDLANRYAKGWQELDERVSALEAKIEALLSK